MHSPVAHGRFSRIDTSGVSSMPGVEAVLTAKEIGALIAEIPVTKLDTNPHHISRSNCHSLTVWCGFGGNPWQWLWRKQSIKPEDAVSALSVNYDQLPISLDNYPCE